MFCSFASWCCFTFVVLGPVFPTLSRQKDLSPITCDNRQRFGLLFRSDSWQHGGFGCATSVHFFYPSHPKAAVLMPLWTQPSSCWTCHKNDEQRLPLFKEDAWQLLHPQALVHWVRIQICVGEFLWLWLQWRRHNTCVCRGSGSFGKGTSLVSVTGKYYQFFVFYSCFFTVFTVVSHCVGVYLVVLYVLFFCLVMMFQAENTIWIT